VDVVHFALTAAAIVVLTGCALAQRLSGSRPAAGKIISSFATASTAVAVLGFGLLARDCLLSGTCAPTPHRSLTQPQAIPHAASRLDLANPAR
jgi:hypothetical protein